MVMNKTGNKKLNCAYLFTALFFINFQKWS